MKSVKHFLETLTPLFAAVAVIGVAVAVAPSAAADTNSEIAPATEDALVVYANFRSREAAEVFALFERLHPNIRVHYELINTAPLYQRFVSENDQNRPSADLVWSPAMNLQMKLINDGYAQSYLPSQRKYLPARAVWNDIAYVISTEPVVFIFNKRLMPEKDVPHSHADVARLLANAGPYRGKVVAYDPVASETGMLLYSQDVQVTRDTWNIARGLGRNDAKFCAVTAEMVRAVAQGAAAFGYNAIGASALELQKQNPDLGVVVPSDYTLVMSRSAFVARNARHPRAARLFLDFLLSKETQALLASHSMTPVRQDVAGPRNQPYLDPRHTQFIPMGLALLSNLDGLVRARFEKDWQRAMQTQ